MVLRRANHDDAARKAIIRIQWSGGFTLIELIMAMAIFSFLLILMTSTLIQLMHINSSALASRNSQQDVRQIIEVIERQLRTAEQIRITKVDTQRRALCLFADGRYLEYAVDGNGDMWRNDKAASLDDCNLAPTVFTGWTRLNTNPDAGANGVKVVRFLVTLPNANDTDGTTGQNSLASIQLSVVATNIIVSDDATISELNPERTACKPAIGSQYCSVMTTVTSAQLRGGAVRQKVKS